MDVSDVIELIDVIDVIKGGIALLAFTLAFYALVARERKTPYITESVYPLILVVLGVILAALLSIIFKPVYQDIPFVLRWISPLLLVSLFIAALFVFSKVWVIHNRHTYFRDDHLIRNTSIYRFLRNLKPKEPPTYEHSPTGIPDTIVNSIVNSAALTKEQLEGAVKHNFSENVGNLSLSVIYNMQSVTKADAISTSLAICFLEQGAYVQYTSIARHPVEFILQLKKAWEEQQPEVRVRVGKEQSWLEVAKNIVAVDAYTPHFGFLDTTHIEWTERLKGGKIGINCLTSGSSFAGIHTSTAKAFNVIKKRHKKRYQELDILPKRPPTLVIYDGPYAIVDLESTEQYRVFMRHLLPSEKLWGSMFTCLIETAVPKSELNLLKSYADIFVNENSEQEQTN